MPNNYLNRHNAAQQRYFAAMRALHGALPHGQGNLPVYGGWEHSTRMTAGLGNAFPQTIPAVARVRRLSTGIRSRASTAIQKHWRGRKTRMNLTYPTPSPPSWPRMRRVAVALGLKKNNTTRGYTLTPNQLKRMSFMFKRKYNK